MLLPSSTKMKMKMMLKMEKGMKMKMVSTYRFFIQSMCSHVHSILYILLTEDGEVVPGEVDEDDSDDDKEGLWQERRLSKKDDRERKAMILRSKLSWEQRYEDDPLKSDKLAKILEPEIDNYQHTFVALGDVAADDIAQRQQAWVHHMQWARRSALLPDTAAKVTWEYTRLAADCMGPAGQVLGIRANSSDIARSLLTVEPLFVTGAVREWQLFEFHQFLHENVSTNVALHDPKLSLGFFNQKEAAKGQDEEEQERHRNYHLHGGVTAAGSISTPRVSMMGRLVPCDDEHSSKRRGVIGNLVLFNAKTNADAERYMAGDPMSSLLDRSMSSISVVNEQDVDGLNHLMPRTFGEKTVLDQVHFMDPEDLLELAVDDLAGLETHRKQNKEALRALEDAGLSFRYSRLGLKERYGTERAAQRGKEYNAGVELTQKVRMLPSIEGLDIDGDDIAIAVASEDFSAGGSDDN